MRGFLLNEGGILFFSQLGDESCDIANETLPLCMGKRSFVFGWLPAKSWHPHLTNVKCNIHPKYCIMTVGLYKVQSPPADVARPIPKSYATNH